MKLIPLENSTACAMVSDHNYEKVRKYKWWIDQHGYVTKNVDFYASQHRMHIFLMGRAQPGFMWDHKDKNKLNNQDDNLRLATSSQNIINRVKALNTRSKYRGVHWNNASWGYHINIDGVQHRKSGFTEEQAARMYDALAKEHHGEFAQLNFPENIVPLESKVA